MTPERLAHLKAYIKNPPSASLNAAWLLELVEALEEVHALLMPAPIPALLTPLEARGLAEDFAAVVPPIPPALPVGDRPTPPEHPKAKAAAKKASK